MHFFKYIFILLFVLSSTASANTYYVAVDNEFGFFSIRNSESNYSDYINQTLKINIGDTVVWQNYAYEDTRIVIISNQKLFPDTTLAWRTKEFSYTFNRSGIFNFYTKEYILHEFNRSDMINSTDLENISIDDTFFKRKYQRIQVQGNYIRETRSTNYPSYIRNATARLRNITRPSRTNVVPSGILKHANETNEMTPMVISYSISDYKKFTIKELIRSYLL